MNHIIFQNGKANRKFINREICFRVYELESRSFRYKSIPVSQFEEDGWIITFTNFNLIYFLQNMSLSFLEQIQFDLTLFDFFPCFRGIESITHCDINATETLIATQKIETELDALIAKQKDSKIENLYRLYAGWDITEKRTCPYATEFLSFNSKDMGVENLRVAAVEACQRFNPKGEWILNTNKLNLLSHLKHEL